MNPLGIGPTRPPNYLAPDSPESGQQVNPPSNPQIVVGAPVPGNPLGINSPVPATPFVQPDTVPHTNPAVTVQKLSVEANLVPGPVAPPAFIQPADIVRVQVPVPPPNTPQIAGGPVKANYIPPQDVRNPVVNPPPVLNGNPLQIEGPLPAYEQPQDQPRPGDAPTVQSAVSSSTGVVLLE
jgi:hypothetical protein